MASVTVWQNPRAKTRWMFMTTTFAAIAMSQLAGYDFEHMPRRDHFLTFPSWCIANSAVLIVPTICPELTRMESQSI